MFNNKPLVCTVCGYVGEAKKHTKGNFLIEVVLWLCFIVPGLIYSIWRLTTKQTICPKCKNSSMIPTDTPVGQKLMNEHQSATPVTPIATSFQSEISTGSPMSTKKKALIIGGIVIGFIAIVGMFDNSTVAPSAPATVVSQETAKEEPLKYEIVKKVAGGTTLTLRVYTQEKEDQRIIQLTDKILSENKGLTHLFIDYFDDKQLAIDYFDDKQLATDYFDKLGNDSISEAEKDKMFSHYIANLKYNTTTNFKVLSKNQNGDWVELKKY